MKLSLLELVTDWREYADVVRPIALGAFNEDELMRLVRSDVYRHCANQLEAALAQQAQPSCDPTTFHAETHVAAGTQQAREQIAEALAPHFLGPDSYNLNHRLRIADAVLALFTSQATRI